MTYVKINKIIAGTDATIAGTDATIAGTDATIAGTDATIAGTDEVDLSHVTHFLANLMMYGWKKLYKSPGV